MDLKHELEQDLISYKFIQLSTLRRVITEKSVRAFLDSNGLRLRPTQLQDIVTNAPRLFTILVLLDRGKTITEYLNENFVDSSFSVLEEIDIPDIHGVDKQALRERRWQIPIVLPRSRHLSLPNEFIPPFLPNIQPQRRSGSFGVVYKEKVASGHLEDHGSSEYVAWKQIRKDDQNDWDIMMREVETLRARRHEYIVPLLASWTQTFIESERPCASLNLLFPYCRMTLDEWLNEQPPDWKICDPKNLKDYIYHSMQCLCEAVAFLHKEIGGKISSHHDLKPKNILVFGKDWKIADFGRTHLMDIASGSDTEGKPGLGSFTSHPPEYWDSSGKHPDVRHGRAFDIWALGCIFVEALTVAVHGWQSQELRRFRDMRKINTDCRIKNFHGRPDTQDEDSYHNNMKIVMDWMRKLRDQDGSFRLISVIDITDTMLSIEPHDRPLSWEVYLNLHELLNPNNTTSEKDIKTKETVQRPNPHHPKHVQNPLQRSAVNANKTRVICLLKVGWCDYPVDIPHLKAQGETDILMMLWIARLLKRMWFRRVAKKLYIKDPKLRSAEDYGKLLAEHDKLDKSSPLNYTGASSGKATVDVNLELDAQGITEFYHICKRGNFWQAQRFLQTVSSDALRMLLTYEDSEGMLPLHHAAKSDSKPLVQLLIDSFNMDATSLLEYPNQKGRTPLHEAAQNGSEKTTWSLLQAHGNRKDYAAKRDHSSMTARDLARSGGYVEVEKLLAKTEHGALSE